MDKSGVNHALKVVSNVTEKILEASVLMKLFVYNSVVSVAVSNIFIAQMVEVLQSHHNDTSLLQDGWWLLRVLAVRNDDINT